MRRRLTSSESRVRRLNPAALVGALVGVALAAWLLSSYGVLRILEVLGSVGWMGMLVVILFHLPQMLCSALGWRAIAGPGELRPRIWLLLRWIREGVNNLLPLAQIGGEFAVARLLRQRGMPLATAIGGTIADLMLEMATQVVFTLLGVALLIHIAGHTQTTEVLTKGLLFAALIVAAVFAGVWLGLASVIEKAVLRMGRSLGWPATAQIGGLHTALAGCLRAPGRVAVAAVWHLLSWLLGGIEVCLVLHFFGHGIGLDRGIIIESLGQAAKAAGFAIPGALGVQEGGYVVVCGLLGIAPEVAIALSLVKRLREVVLGVPGLVSWQRIEAASGDRAVA